MEKYQTNLVTYDNKINQISFKGLKPLELNILNVMMATARNFNGEPVSMSFNELKELSQWKNTSGSSRLVDSIRKFNQKLIGLSLPFYNIETGDEGHIAMFQKIWLNERTQGVVFELNRQFVQYYNDLTSSFTSYQLEDMTGLKGFYPKEIYRMMNSQKGTYRYQQNDGWNVWREPIESFRGFLGIPKSYQMANIDQRVLQPALEQIMQNNLFADMKIEKEKNGVGNKITDIAIYFKTHDQAEKEKNRKEEIKNQKEQAEKERQEKEWKENMMKHLRVAK